MAPRKPKEPEEVFLVHPVTPAQKAALRASGYKIVDIAYAPAGYKLPKEAAELLVEYGDEEDDADDEPAESAQRPAKRGKRTAGTSTAAESETSAQPAANAESGGGNGADAAAAAEAAAKAAEAAANEMKDEELREAIGKATGVTPPPFAKHEDLVTQYLATLKK